MKLTAQLVRSAHTSFAQSTHCIPYHSSAKCCFLHDNLYRVTIANIRVEGNSSRSLRASGSSFLYVHLRGGQHYGSGKSSKGQLLRRHYVTCVSSSSLIAVQLCVTFLCRFLVPSFFLISKTRGASFLPQGQLLPSISLDVLVRSIKDLLLRLRNCAW